MARRRPQSGRSRPRRRRSGTAERWLLLLGIVAAIVLVAGIVGPWRAGPPPNVAEPLTMAQARASNAAVPIDRSRRRRAEPYRFHGGRAEREQAIECLATAARYEVGDDHRGQAAVIQVVLNRVRAAGFPRTICGVVYQGSNRRIGCQFSFTCDGSIQRRTIHTGWGHARRAARRALDGHVFAEVGRATHYHADWIVPYWRDTMVKIAQVGPHLFYVRA